MNSELRRYYWQDFSVQRWIAMPAVLITIAAIIGFDADSAWSRLIYCIFAYFILIFCWGGYRAANAISEEITANTWDYLRLSSLSAAELSLGKLWGSTSYVWYGALIILGIWGISVYQSGWDSVKIIYYTGLSFTAGVFCHALAIILSLRLQHSPRDYQKPQPILYSIAALVAGLAFFAIGSHFYPYAMTTNPWQETIESWYQLDINLLCFVIISLAVFLLWSLIGLYRCMRAALQYRSYPWVFIAFIIFLIAYICGFSTDSALLKAMNFPSNASPLSTAYEVSIFMIYPLLFMDSPLNITRYRILWQHWHQRAWSELFICLPMWLVALLLSLFFALGLLFDASSSFVYVFGILCFLLRDICILHCFSFNPSMRYTGLATLFYWGVLYGLLPALWGAAKLGDGDFIFQAVHSSNLFELLPVILQVFIAAALLYRRYHKTNKRIPV